MGDLLAEDDLEVNRILSVHGYLALDVFDVLPLRVALLGDRRLPDRDLHHVLRLIASGLRVGIPVDRILRDAERRATGSQAVCLRAVVRRLEQGHSLGTAVLAAPGLFSDPVPSVIAIAQETGNLPEALERLEATLALRSRQKSRLLQSMVYPSAIVVLTMPAVFLAGAVVLPGLVETLESLGTQVPAGTKLLIRAVALVRRSWPVWLASAAGGILMTRALARDGRALLMRAPILGPALTKSAWADFCLTALSCLRAGLKTLEAFNLASRTGASREVSSVVARACGLLERGVPLEMCLDRFEPLVRRAVITGSSSNDLEGSLSQAALILEADSERTVNMLLSVAQPVVTSLVSLAVGLAVVLICLPVLTPVIPM